MPYTHLSPELACEALHKVGLHLHPDEVRVRERDACWLIELPHDQIAWFAASQEGLARLCVERKVLARLQSRCGFQAPRILHESDDGSIDLRAKVQGVCEPWSIYARVKHDGRLAARIGRAVGSILAEQHTRIVWKDVDPWLPRQVTWPQSSAWIRERVSHVVSDSHLVRDIDAVLAMYDGLAVEERDRVLAHTDLGLHNLAFDPATFDVCGIFDYGEAAWVDRHYDFRYLVFDLDRWEMLEAAMAAYEAVVGRRLSPQRVLLYNAVSACSYLAHRFGVAPEEKCCGRTLVEDLAWTGSATQRVQTDFA
jgi:hypothetical protein